MKGQTKRMHMTKKQIKTKEILLSKGAIEQEGVDRVVWFLGRCLLIHEDGTYEDL